MADLMRHVGRCGLALACSIATFSCGGHEAPPAAPVDAAADGSEGMTPSTARDASPGEGAGAVVESGPSGDENAREAQQEPHEEDGQATLDAPPLGAANDARIDDHDSGSDGPARPVTNPSCVGLAPICGPDGVSDCCASSVVPGGMFNRSNDPLFPARVSDFRLDRYEVTVGRFRRFVAAYPADKPNPGSGQNPRDTTDTGWNPMWPLPADQATLIRQLKLVMATWRDTPGSTENLPINSLNWFVAFAFCIWDGGRLPTEAEWNYAAAGGSEQRYYPWSNPPDSTTIDPSYAVYLTSTQDPPVSPVGSRSPRGDGRWGHADLAGNLWEFTRDQLDTNASYATPCLDCTSPQPIDLMSAISYPGDAIRGGGFYHSPQDLWTGKRSNIPPSSPEGDIGVRCARAP